MGAQCHRCDQSPDHFPLVRLRGTLGIESEPMHESVEVCLQEALAQVEDHASAALRLTSLVRHAIQDFQRMGQYEVAMLVEHDLNKIILGE